MNNLGIEGGTVDRKRTKDSLSLKKSGVSCGVPLERELRKVELGPVVGLSIQDGESAVQLFQKQEIGQLVGKSERRE